MKLCRVAVVFGCLLALAGQSAVRVAPSVHLEPVPSHGLQPQVAVDRHGRTHLIYLTGEAATADVQYSWRSAGSTNWSVPVRVNATPGSAIAVGTIRGPQLALGTEGRVHVCWNGSNAAQPKPEQGGAPLLYTRLATDGRTFEPERNLGGRTRYLDGGGSLAADAEGRVFVVWHAAAADGPGGETNRAVYLAASTDDGRSFAPERRVSPSGSGACGCCGLRALADHAGRVFVWYRGASASDQRPATLLTSNDHGVTFSVAVQDPWAMGQCPMSSAGITETSTSGSEFAATWETAGQIRWARFNRMSGQGLPEHKIQTLKTLKSPKHPVLAASPAGETLLAWTEGTGWQRGGTLAWQVLDAHDAVVAEGRRGGVPVWGSLAAFAEADGSFTILY